MKKILMMAALMLLLAACGSGSESNHLVGTWTLDAVDGEKLNEEEKKLTATFNKDGSFERRRSPDSEASKGTWEIKKEGDKKMLNLVINGKPESDEIKKLDATTLVFVNRGKEITLKKNK